jgi:hypothetical protein
VPPPASAKLPTISHFVVTGHETAVRNASAALPRGSPLTSDGTCQIEPFQVSGSAEKPDLPLESSPAATHRVPDGHDTPESALNEPGFWVVWIVHGGVTAAAAAAVSSGNATTAPRRLIINPPRRVPRRGREKTCMVKPPWNRQG